jgi:UDP-N-acetylmuramoyl-L-alanyl-D-glutamate--2,6-diaminopimelate ligase
VTAAARRLDFLLEGIAAPQAAAAARETVVRGLTLDSRRLHAGDAFIALKGTTEHGFSFAPAALASGAAAILAEAPAPAAFIQTPAIRRGQGAPVIWIDGLREQVGEIAARFFGRPSSALHAIGVTGTNGKTSIVQLLAAALEILGGRAATIGTLGAGLNGAIRAGERTTPDAITVHALLAEFRNAGAGFAALEVTSHALEQGRVNAVEFEVAVFTNLTRDHLDYHGSMEAYGAAKAKLFAWPGLRSAVINTDDAFGRQLVLGLDGAVRRLRYAIDDSAAEIRAQDVRGSDTGLQFLLITPWGRETLATPLLGRFNVYNLLAVAACLGVLGFDFAQIHNALSQLRPVPGRMSTLGGGTAPLVVVDYAHTPDALEQALSNLRAHCAGKLICVFGCGGERDKGKRPLMGAIAEKLADRIIITDDNPRGEDGDVIVAQIVAGLAHPHSAVVQRDRAAAIALALDHARAGDVVLIAGKGHEPYQEIRGVRHAFDDVLVARSELEARPC